MLTTIHRRITVGVVLFLALRPSGLQFSIHEQPRKAIDSSMHEVCDKLNADNRRHMVRCTTECVTMWYRQMTVTVTTSLMQA